MIEIAHSLGLAILAYWVFVILLTWIVLEKDVDKGEAKAILFIAFTLSLAVFLLSL